MTSIRLQIPDATRQMLPEAMIQSTTLSPSRETLATVNSSVSEDEGTQPLTIRANSLTAILKGIRGYNHDGLNE